MSAIHDHEYFAEHCDDREPRSTHFETDCESPSEDCFEEPVNDAMSGLCAYHLRKLIVAGLIANDDTYDDAKAEAIAWSQAFFESDEGLNYIRRELERGAR